MTDTTPAVAIEGLRKMFGTHAAVDGADLVVHPGEILGVLGPNGAGKTTTIRVLTTLLPYDEGSVQVFGREVSENRFAIRRLIGYVPQQLSADGTLDGEENVALFARLFDVPRKQRADRVAECLDLMGLSDAKKRLARTYSGGMVRRLELAQALVSRPRLLMLDEPTIGLDPVGREGVWERIEDLRDSAGVTVLVTTHYMEEADQHCDRVALMHKGTVRAIGTPRALKESLGPEASLEDVFRSYTGDALEEGGDLRGVRSTRRTAGRLG
ncbi:MAG TPA: ATP-binding cassette domain-containing protein [Acidimicrobiales bacterium]|nr:ATP-binding cassette domain-containing protein [Acidimicrobiales bacterium]